MNSRQYKCERMQESENEGHKECKKIYFFFNQQQNIPLATHINDILYIISFEFVIFFLLQTFDFNVNTECDNNGDFLLHIVVREGMVVFVASHICVRDYISSLY